MAWLGNPEFASLRRAWDWVLSLWKSPGDVPVEPLSSPDCDVLRGQQCATSPSQEHLQVGSLLHRETLALWVFGRLQNL